MSEGRLLNGTAGTTITLDQIYSIFFFFGGGGGGVSLSARTNGWVYVKGPEPGGGPGGASPGSSHSLANQAQKLL